MKKFILSPWFPSALFLSLLWGAPPASAQNAQVQTQQNIQKTAASPTKPAKWSEDEEEDFGKIFELKKPKSWWITPYIDFRGYWTSNALLTSGPGEKGDAVYVDTQGFDGGYRLSDDWTVQAGYNFQTIRYEENPAIDTDGHNPYLSSTYQLPWNWQVTGGARGMWLDSPHMNTQVYREFNPYVSLLQSWDFLDNRLGVFYGYEYDRKYAHPVTFDRDEHTVFAGVNYSWMPNLISQLVLRQNWQFYDAPQFPGASMGRMDWVSNVATQTIWQPLNWMQVSAFALLGYDNTINAARDYKVANLGGELKFFWKF